MVPTLASVTETIPAGQTLTQVADFYKVNPDVLATENQMPKVSVLKEGQVIRVNVGAQMPTKQVAVVAPQLADGKLSQVNQVKTVVALSPSGDVTGADQQQAEWVREKSEQPGQAAAVESTYRVGPGDTLTSIARNHGVSYRELADLNAITNPNQLLANQVLKLPVKTVANGLEAADRKVVATAIAPEALRQQLVNPASSPSVNFAAPQGVLQDASAPKSQASAFVTQAELVQQAQQAQPQLTGSLATEVRNLRQKFQERTIVPAVVVPRVPTSAPAFVSTSAAQSEEAKRSKQLAMALQDAATNTPKREENEIPVPAVPSKQLVARSSLGAGEYAPVDGGVRRLVAPSLPGLGREDAYLPGSQAMTGYIWPAKGEFTSPYGPRWGRMHRGIDVAAPTGTPVVASAPGVVSEVGWDGYGYGNYVEITHPDGAVTLYGHNDRVLVREGQVVAQGEQISEMGSTGRSTGPHVHFEIHLAGRGAVNPIAYLDRQG
ncbi:MAG: peptidoglycan DD-metalloendopeptidase family protein [Alkalinema sp. RU_4_3]|nr:peptidoglycan DD-metalloendopeptidase family protein [Alkalinema sp. RU_4_3]